MKLYEISEDRGKTWRNEWLLPCDVLKYKLAGYVVKPKINTIYTHDEAMLIVELFDDILVDNNIRIPSPEDDQREPENMAGLYGTTYSDLFDEIEERLIRILNRHEENSKVITYMFSGTV